jgi:hypothetical protein
VKGPTGVSTTAYESAFIAMAILGNPKTKNPSYEANKAYKSEVKCRGKFNFTDNLAGLKL